MTIESSLVRLAKHFLLDPPQEQLAQYTLQGVARR